MVDYNEQIKEIEKEMAKMQYNKRTQHHYGLLRAKVAKLKERDIARSGSGKGSHGYNVRKSGDATVILVGFPSSGKSTLLNKLTGAKSPVGSYEFTTLEVIPGVMKHNSAKIQILDVPGIVRGAASGTGRGKEVLACIQSAELVLILVDTLRPNAVKVIQKEIYDANVRLNKRKPDVKITKTSKGGVDIGKTVKTEIDNKTIEAIMKEMRLINASIVIRENINIDDLIDVIENNKKYVPGLIVMNKIDLVSKEELESLKRKYNVDICVSAEKDINLEKLKDLIYEKLNLIRIYCKEIGKKADLEVPLIIRKDSTIKYVCEKLDKDFVKNFKFARIWGKSVKYEGQKIVKFEHKLIDNDIIELHIK